MVKNKEKTKIQKNEGGLSSPWSKVTPHLWNLWLELQLREASQFLRREKSKEDTANFLAVEEAINTI